MAELDVVRDADGTAGVAASLLASVAEAMSGDLGRAAPLPLALGLRKGEAVRLALEGVPDREGGLLGRLMVGLSQEEKKSSSCSPDGVSVPEPSASGVSVMTTSLGYLKVETQ